MEWKVRSWVQDPLDASVNLTNKKKKRRRNRHERMAPRVLSPLASHDPLGPSYNTILAIVVVNLNEEVVIAHVRWVIAVVKLHVRV
jgi:hypothetical protein